MEVTVDLRPRASRLARARPRIAVIVAAIIFALIPQCALSLQPMRPEPVEGHRTGLARSARISVDQRLGYGAV